MADDKGRKGDSEETEDGDDPVGDLGGIFGVATSGKKKKKKKKKKASQPEPDEAIEEDSIPFPSEDASTPEVDENAKTTIHSKDDGDHEDEEPIAEKKKKKKKKKADGIEGILTPSTEESGIDYDYLNDDDLGDIQPPKSKTVNMLVGVIVVLVIALIGVGVVMTDSGGDLVALFKGELREKRIQEAKMKEEKFKKEQLDKLDLFGNMIITGNPKYAAITLNGERHYGRTTSGAWREIRIGAISGIQNLKIKEEHEIVVTAPGYDPATFKIQQGMWNDGVGGEYIYAYTASLPPKNIETKTEFDARMSEDPDNEFYGTVTLNTVPAGAKVTINNKPLLNEKGEELATPVTFDKFWVKDEKTGKLEERLVRVDATLDIGNKIELEMAYETNCPSDKGVEVGKQDGCCPPEATVATDTDCKTPKVVEALQRQMWTCNWKDGAFPAKIGKGKTVQHYCEYSYKMDVDFNALKTYIIKRHEELERIKQQLKEFKKEKEKAKEGGEQTATK